MADKEIGILLITEKLSNEFPEIINEIKLNRLLPLIVEIPDRHGTGRKPDFITSYVSEAIGLKLQRKDVNSYEIRYYTRSLL